MRDLVQENTIKYNEALVQEVLPMMPKKGDIKAKLQFCGIVAARQAKLQKQIDWLHERQEFYRQLRGE